MTLALAPGPPRDSFAVRFQRLTKPERVAFLATLPSDDISAILYTWAMWARPDQLLPPGDWFCWLVDSGRGWGKTRTGAEAIRAWAEQAARERRVERYALVAETRADTRDVMIEGESGLLAISPPSYRPIYEPSKRLVTWPNGTYALTFSGEDPDQLRGPQFDKAWADELAKWQYAEEAWDNLEFGLRLGRKPRVVATTTPRPIPLIKKLLVDPEVHVTRGSSYDNLPNVAQSWIRRIIGKYEGTRLGRQELHAELLTDTPGALWTQARLELNRVRRAKGGGAPVKLLRIIISIDPAVSAEEDSDETGITVGGRGEDGHAYLLADLSGIFTPTQWAERAIAAFHSYQADRIVAETNNGGDLVETVLRMVDPHVPYRKVTATRSKGSRAEPVAALYEQGKVHHVGTFAKLEDQMCLQTPDEYLGPGSPDRSDSWVWAVFDLLIKRQIPSAAEYKGHGGRR